MKHFKQILATCIWNTCNIYNIPDLLLQHLYKITATYLWNVWNTWNIHLQHKGGGAPVPINVRNWPTHRGSSLPSRASTTSIQRQRRVRAPPLLAPGLVRLGIARATGKASTTSTNACDGRERAACATGRERAPAAAWGVCVRVQDRQPQGALTREKETEGIRMGDFLF